MTIYLLGYNLVIEGILDFIPIKGNIYLFSNKRKEIIGMAEITLAPVVPRKDEQKLMTRKVTNRL